MSRHPIARTLFLLLRDALGRFARVRASVTEKPARCRVRRPRPVLTAVQLALFWQVKEPTMSQHPASGRPDAVKDDLTPDRSAEHASTNRPTRPTRRRRTTVENTDYAAFATRVIRGHARRIADGDIDGLTNLLRLSRELDAATQQAVDGLRASGYSWADIAARLGTTRRAAQQRWGQSRSE
jgi:hypothetical protein